MAQLPLEINYFYVITDWELEKKIQLHQLKSSSFFFSKFLFLGILTYIFILNWSNIFYSSPFDAKMYLIFFVTIPPMVFLCVIVTALHATVPSEQIIHDRFVQCLMYLMVLWINGGFNGVISYVVYYDLCSPMRMMANIDCGSFYFPTELMVIQLFLPVLVQHAFPGFGWLSLLFLYLICFCQVVSEAAVTNAMTAAPLITVTVIYSFGSLLTLRSETLKSYQLHVDMEEKRTIEQEAQLGQRLRTMISGVAHDLKSPISALALGLDCVKQLSQNAQQRKNKESAINPARLVNSSQGSSGDDKTREYNNIVEWLEATKDAMVMIISRCVDVNQALSGLPLTPNYGQVHLHEEVNNIVQFFRDESPQVRIRVQWKPHREGDSSLPDNFWSNVVTDRVWFIQSLHCYVENAVKFSDYTSHAQHEVEVDLSLVTSCEPATLNHFAKSVMAIREKNAARLNASQEVSRPASPSLATFKFIRIEVRDSGIGVSPAMRPFLFGFSHHQETQMKVGGAGLGLFSVHSRIHALGGKVGYQPGRSNDGTEKGSVFWFEVPYEQDKFLESRMEGKFSDMHNRRIENKNNSEKVEKSQTKLDLQHKLAKQILRDGSIRIGDIESDAIGESQPMLHDNIDATSPNDSVHKTEVISEGSPTVVLPCSLDSQAKSSESSSAEDSHKVSFREIQNASSVLPSVISLQAVSKIPGYQIHDGEQENSLPTSGPSDVDSTSVTSAVSIASNRTPRRMTKLKILVVDDSLPIRKICSVILNQNGHFVETASNGKEALQKMVASLIARRKYESDQRNLYTPAENKNNDNTGAQYDAKCGELDNSMACRVSNSTSIDDIVNSSQSSTIYDLVLMDIQMPVMDGIEAVTRYRAFEKEQLLQHVLHSTGLSAKENGAAGGHLVDLQLPIIAMSASSDSAIISKAIAEGMSHFIAKPFQMHQFETIISEIMY